MSALPINFVTIIVVTKQRNSKRNITEPNAI